ncbi:hypothetical protein [Aeromonas enteropelogenes]|uniref:hypothetical protein n=1 Tax=Aeromonas enteropelogenes TaxID=29489 RepID=UPI003F743584
MDKLNGPMENLNAANYTGAGRACQGLFMLGSACSLKKTARSDHRIWLEIGQPGGICFATYRDEG